MAMHHDLGFVAATFLTYFVFHYSPKSVFDADGALPKTDLGTRRRTAPRRILALRSFSTLPTSPAPTASLGCTTGFGAAAATGAATFVGFLDGEIKLENTDEATARKINFDISNS